MRPRPAAEAACPFEVDHVLRDCSAGPLDLHHALQDPWTCITPCRTPGPASHPAGPLDLQGVMQDPWTCITPCRTPGPSPNDLEERSAEVVTDGSDPSGGNRIRRREPTTCRADESPPGILSETVRLRQGPKTLCQASKKLCQSQDLLCQQRGIVDGGCSSAVSEPGCWVGSEPWVKRHPKTYKIPILFQFWRFGEHERGRRPGT